MNEKMNMEAAAGGINEQNVTNILETLTTVIEKLTEQMDKHPNVETINSMVGMAYRLNDTVIHMIDYLESKSPTVAASKNVDLKKE